MEKWMTELWVLTSAIIKHKHKIIPHFDPDLELIFLNMKFFIINDLDTYILL